MAPAVTVRWRTSSAIRSTDSGATVTLSTVPEREPWRDTRRPPTALAWRPSAPSSSTPAGSYTLKASSTGLSPASAPFTVTKESTTTSLSISATLGHLRQRADDHFTATVTPAVLGHATGTMTVQTGSTVLCTITLPAKTCSDHGHKARILREPERIPGHCLLRRRQQLHGFDLQQPEPGGDPGLDQDNGLAVPDLRPLRRRVGHGVQRQGDHSLRRGSARTATRSR